jgi:hypothetical protein
MKIKQAHVTNSSSVNYLIVGNIVHEPQPGDVVVGDMLYEGLDVIKITDENIVAVMIYMMEEYQVFRPTVFFEFYDGDTKVIHIPEGDYVVQIGEADYYPSETSKEIEERYGKGGRCA